MLFTRPDGTRATDVAPFRQMMPFIMPTRTESAVAFEQIIDLTKTVGFIEGWNAKHPDRRISVFHLFMYAVPRMMEQRPRLNRFVMGSRIWQRDGVWLSFAAKKKLEDGAPLVVLKRRFDPAATFPALVDFLHGDVKSGRSDAPTHVDKELSLFLKLPAPLLRWGVRVLRWLDSWNLVPGGFIRGDPLYCSMFVANLGSVRLESAYHHLYEYGNCPFFAAIGRTKTEVSPQGERPVCSIKYSFDERIEDGLYCAKALEQLRDLLEDPAKQLGEFV